MYISLPEGRPLSCRFDLRKEQPSAGQQTKPVRQSGNVDRKQFEA